MLLVRDSPRRKWPKIVKNKTVDEHIVDQLTCSASARAGSPFMKIHFEATASNAGKILMRARKIRLPWSL